MSSFAVSHNLLLGAPTGTLIGNYSGVLTAALNPSQVRNMLGLSDILSGPVSSTDNAIVRFDGLTGKLLQDSNCSIDDSGILRIQSLDTIKYLEFSHNNTRAIINDTHTAGLEVQRGGVTCIQFGSTTVSMPPGSVLSCTTVRAPGSSHLLGSAGYELGSGLYIRWSSNSIYTGAKDWGIERIGSESGKISNGGTGYGSLGLKQLVVVASDSGSTVTFAANAGFTGGSLTVNAGSFGITCTSTNIISNTLGFLPGGNSRARLDTTGWQIANNYVYGFSSSTSVGTIDTAIGRTSSAGLESNNGTLGSYRDFTSRNSIAYGSVVARATNGVANVDEINVSYSSGNANIEVMSGVMNFWAPDGAFTNRINFGRRGAGNQYAMHITYGVGGQENSVRVPYILNAGGTNYTTAIGLHWNGPQIRIPESRCIRWGTTTDINIASVGLYGMSGCLYVNDATTTGGTNYRDIAARKFIARSESGVVGTQEVQLSYNGGSGVLECMNGPWIFKTPLSSQGFQFVKGPSNTSVGSYDGGDTWRFSSYVFVTTRVMAPTVGVGPQDSTQTYLSQPNSRNLRIAGASSTLSGTAGISYAVNRVTQFTSDMNDVTLDAGYIYYMSSDASRTLTGFRFTVNNAVQDGQMVYFVNTGANNIVLAHESSGSVAANRFSCIGSTDLTMISNQITTLIYDSGITRWRVS